MRIKVDRGDGKSVELHEMFRPFDENIEFFMASTHALFLPEVQNALKGVYDIDSINGRIKHKINSDGTIGAALGPLLELQYQMIIITAYENLKLSTYKPQVNKLDEVIFLRHLRNGCAHGNKFNITHPIKRAISWKGKVIENSLDGTKVIGKFMNFVEVPALFADISEILKSIDNKWTKK